MGRRIKQILFVAFLAIACFSVWIVMLYMRKAQEEKAWEREFLTRYHGALNDMAYSLGRFQKTESYEEQLSCLQEIINDLTQLKAYMEMHINLAGISMPDKTGGVDTAGWRETESVAGFIRNGGSINSRQIAAFQADGVISEQEAAVIQFLREETEKLYGDMTVMEDGANYRYVLSSLEVYQRLTEIMKDAKAQLLRINEE